MDAVEIRLERLLQHLARESRQLLAMLRLGYTLRKAEGILAAEKESAASGGAAEGTEKEQENRK